MTQHAQTKSEGDLETVILYIARGGAPARERHTFSGLCGVWIDRGGVAELAVQRVLEQRVDANDLESFNRMDLCKGIGQRFQGSYQPLVQLL